HAAALDRLYTPPDTTDRVPRYEAFPLRHTVEEHVRSAGAHITAGGDILLWVHNFTGGQREAVHQMGDLDPGRIEVVLNTAQEAVRRERVVGVADVSSANGAVRA